MSTEQAPAVPSPSPCVTTLQDVRSTSGAQCDTGRESLCSAQLGCVSAPRQNAWPCCLVSPQLELAPLFSKDPMCQEQCISSLVTHLGLVCVYQRREGPFAGNMGDLGEEGRELSEIHMLQGWGCVQAVLFVQLWEK